MPKFFIHYGSKVQKSLSRGSKSGTERKSKPRFTGYQDKESTPSDARPLCSRECSGYDGSGNWKDQKQATNSAAQVTFDESEAASSMTATSPKRISRISHEV